MGSIEFHRPGVKNCTGYCSVKSDSFHVRIRRITREFLTQSQSPRNRPSLPLPARLVRSMETRPLESCHKPFAKKSGGVMARGLAEKHLLVATGAALLQVPIR